ncbi:MAG: 2-oxoglutarate and iron-dependent oxygenase domain-containing protein [Pseudomonadales bacterium]|nr:2-oxoglutarate and iron-dependent oxygenase domain-containing protein [Pseudomonadales bacterium]
MSASEHFSHSPRPARLETAALVRMARGYTPVGAETAKGGEHPDLTEFWHVGRERAAGHPLRHYMPATIWPAELDAMRRLTCVRHCDGVSARTEPTRNNALM